MTSNWWALSYVWCDQIGRFLEILGHKLYNKSSPNVWWLFGQLWNPLLFKSNWKRYILGNFWKNLGYFLCQHLVTLFPCCVRRETSMRARGFVTSEIVRLLRARSKFLKDTKLWSVRRLTSLAPSTIWNLVLAVYFLAQNANNSKKNFESVVQHKYHAYVIEMKSLPSSFSRLLK